MNKLGSLILVSVLTGCATPAQHMAALHSTSDREMTVGVVQREIRVGMDQGDLASSLGSPNIVTSDANGIETWIYDKIATEASYSSDTGGVGGGIGAGGFPGATLLLGGVGGNYSKTAGAYAQTQKTLTVVIKFDRRKLVSSFSYHSSKF